ncbi:MAG TPA: SUMF1/EgtB/PvdO family nonheme iron enzyme [Spirochaetota bacterium]|nr:SUMF1/EgtB/PvdO family nonheme iron enzyme [Spirochaetota bacterium]HOL58171.1 SUMF1/EgtB/PvdO family nonheme iron enzyme [Spirochaetota bacterium]HPP05676.1 SUMF1/EgtB/PvdO family nonheme iron enzyme [Spirochaetota bacterium]
MKRILVLGFFLFCISIFPQNISSERKDDTNFIFVEGGEIKSSKSFFYKKSVEGFYISKYEVTQKEWVEVMGTNPSSHSNDPEWEKLPVDKISWYDAIEYCNKRSIKEGLTPVYEINKEVKDPDNISKYDDKKYLIKINPDANGYRLPTEIEWEYAATGGKYGQFDCFSGSNEPELVAVYNSMFENNNRIKPVGSKKSNELGIYDMCGNVAEWCWDWYVDAKGNKNGYKVVRGGSYESNLTEIAICYRGDYRSPIYSFKGVGLRLVRSRLD